MKDRQHIRSRVVGVNIPPGERIVSGLAGGALAVIGISRRSVGGLVVAGAGAAAMVRALTGRCAVYRARAIRRGIHIRRVTTIQCTPREVYELWRDLTNLPRFMHHVESVTMEDDVISRWVIKEGPKSLSYRAEIVEDTPARRLRWRSLPGGDLAHEGQLDVREAPAGRGTEVEVKLHYFPPGGLVVASALYAFLRRITHVQVGIELARLRQLIETGEIATGVHRFIDLEADAMTAVDGARLRPQVTSPVTSAGQSVWPTAPGTGGAR